MIPHPDLNQFHILNPLSEEIVREPLGMDSKTWPQGNTANLPSFSPEKPLPILKGDCVKNRCPDLYGIMIYYF